MITGLNNRRNIRCYSSGVCLKCDPPKLWTSLAQHFRQHPNHKPLPVEIIPPVVFENQLQEHNDENHEQIHDKTKTVRTRKRKCS